MPVRFGSMLDFMAEMVGISKEVLATDQDVDIVQIQENDVVPPLYVLGNQAGISGAAAILYPGILKTYAEALNGNLYILPSSIHEVLLLPHEEKVDAAELAEMIQYINGAEVPREEWLSDHACFYYHEDDSLIAV